MNRTTLFAIVMFSVALVGCVETPNGPGDVVTEDPTTAEPAETKRASLEAAVPADGDVVSGDFVMAAVLDGTDAEVRFMVDGSEIGVVNEAPFQLKMNACDLSAGNHFFMVVVEGPDGDAQHLEQWFTSSCD